MAKLTPKPHVPEQYRGFSLQPTRMALMLLDADDGALVSMELIDDVGLENPDKTEVASQTKSVRKTNPVADRSPALWKAFANWTRAVRCGEFDAARTTFEIYVNRAVSGEMVGQFHNAKTKEQAIKAFEFARESLWGDTPKYLQRSKVSEALKPHLEEVLGCGAPAFKSILPRFQLTCAIKTPALDLHARVASWPTVQDHAVIDLVCHLHGWLKVRVDEQLEVGKAPVIARNDFWRELRAFYGRLVPSGALPDLAPKPTPEEILRLMTLTFVQQLELIKADPDTLTRAMACYFKAGSVRSRWGKLGLVHDDSLDDLENSLMQVYRHISTDVFSDPQRTDEVLRGKILHGRCDQHRCKVEEKEVPDYFIPGCFHTLANKKLLGWHPRYLELLTPVVA